MDLPAPQNLTDVVTDGFIAQHAGTWEYIKAFGPQPRVDFLPNDHGYTVIYNSTSEFSATRMATIRGQQLTWERPAPFEIPELNGTTQLSDDVIAAARTLHGNGPAFLVPEGDETFVVVVVDKPLHNVRTGDAIRIALAHAALHDIKLDVERALISFASFAGLGIRVNSGVCTLSDGTVVHAPTGLVKTPHDAHTLNSLISDAEIFSIESQLYFDGRFPQATLRQTSDTTVDVMCATTNTAFHADATPIATITDTFNWIHSPATDAIRSWALTHTIPELLEKDIPLAKARELGLEIAAKPLLRKWTHGFIQQPDGSYTVVLLDAPELRLPAPSAQGSAASIIRTRARINPRRALENYGYSRGIHVQIPTDLRQQPSRITAGGHTFDVIWEETNEKPHYLFTDGTDEPVAVRPGKFALL